VEQLRARHLLLVLDNFEHLTAHAPFLASLLEQCTDVKLIVTSRARLGLPMEQLLPLEGLPVPDPEDEDHFDAFDAVRLFVKTARRMEPALVPEAEAAAIVDICRQVDGLPLAIELAASWARVLSCDAIATQLRDGLQLLRSADATRPARHASMEVVFDESWRLLGPAERDALSRLAVFEGGFTPEAARAVAQASLPVLAALVDKSLLRKDGSRLHLHPLLHQLAAARLEQGSLHEEAHRAHAAYFHRLLSQLRRGVTEADSEAVATIEREFPNCRAAWRWAARNGMGGALMGSVFTLMYFFDHRFRLDGLSLFEEALGSRAAREDRKVEALVTATAAHLQYRLDRYGEAEAGAQRALAATQAGGDFDTRMQCYKVLGGCCLRTGRLEESKHWFKQALRHAVSPATTAGMLDNVAIVEKLLGHYDEALRLSQRALLQYRAIRSHAGEALCLNNLGTLLVDRREYDAARTHLTDGLALCERHGLDNTRAMVMGNLLELEINTGDYEAAAGYARDALEMAESTGTTGLASWIRIQMARLAVHRGDLSTARGELAAAIELALSIGRRNLQFTAMVCLAEILTAQGEPGVAKAMMGACLREPDIPAPERDQMKGLLAGAGENQPWPAISFDELVHRVVLEKETAYAPLIGAVAALTPRYPRSRAPAAPA
jgi:predicted ATPase/Tfp pilus assembly protein PilF